MTNAPLLRAILAALAATAGHAQAVNLSPNGFGQALIFPYYTVNAGQQTLITIGNATDVGKAVRVRFLEAHNGRSVLEFNLFLASNDIWTGNVFKLADAGLPGDGAAIFSTDNSCTAPQFAQGTLPGIGVNYQSFLDYAFTGSRSDSGPTDDSRTREGHFEVIAMSDIVAGSALDHDTIPVNSVPPGCAQAERDFEAGADTVGPTSGLFGAASIVDVAQGTIYAYNAEALEGFTFVKLDADPSVEKPTLASVNDAGGATATSHVFANGRVIDSVFPAGRAVDAVSSLWMAEALYNEYVYQPSDASGTDWVLSFPTKRFYVDPTVSTLGAAPFEHLFGAKETGNGIGLSCAFTPYVVFDRERNVTQGMHCSFCPCPPASQAPQPCLETSVVRFSDASVLGSDNAQLEIYPIGTGGAVRMDLGNSRQHALPASSNGNVFYGLPVVGFAVTKYVNGSVPQTGGGSALSNYSATYRHRGTTTCVNGSGSC